MHERGTGWNPELTPWGALGSGLSVFEDGEWVDSADIVHQKPLYEVVKERIHNWRAIGASDMILDWIENGVYFEPIKEIPNYFHKQLKHTTEARAYWHSKLKPHYLGSGSIRQIDPP